MAVIGRCRLEVGGFIRLDPTIATGNLKIKAGFEVRVERGVDLVILEVV